MNRISFLLVVCCMVCVGFLIGCGPSNKTAQARSFAESAFKDIGTSWNDMTLKRYAGPEFYAKLPEPQAKALCRELNRVLGPITACRGSSILGPTPTPPAVPDPKNPLVYNVVVEADFRNAPVTATLAVMERSEGQWSINGFSLHSPVLDQLPKASATPASQMQLSPSPVKTP